MTKFNARRSFSAMMTLVLVLSSVLPGARSMRPRIVSAYAPSPPATAIPAQPFASLPLEMPPSGKEQFSPAPPVPGELAPEIEQARAREAIEATLQKHLDYWGPHYQTDPVEVTVAGEWAYGVSEGPGVDQMRDGSIHVLAHRSEDGTWQALLPGEGGLYRQWVEEAPASLLSASTREKMRRQAAQADELLPSPSTGTDRFSDPLGLPIPPTDSADEVPVQSMRNPAAVYCAELGYEYRVIRDADGGQRGICQLPGDTTCDAWRFLEGRCGREYNACAREGLQTVTRSDGINPYSPSAAWCVDEDGQDVTSALDAINLVETLMGHTPLRTITGPADAVDGPSRVTSTSFDWRNYDGVNWLTPIKNQGMCGSCWAFAAVGVAEAATNIGYRDHTIDPDMSEQYLVTDCAANAGDCAGGWGTSALTYIRDSGIPDEACLPYHDGSYTTGCTFVSSTGDCDCNWCTHCSDTECSDYQCSDRCSDWASRLYSVARVDTVWYPSRDDIKAELLAHGPLAVSIYMGGEFDANNVFRCTDPPNTNHGVSIVGYDDAGGYWIVRNSWGSTWNNDGYFKVAYGNCLIENYFTYADLVACNDGNEINDSADLATGIAYGQTIDAEICASGDEDFYQFDGTAGDQVVVDIDARSEGSALDSYIYLLDSDGSTVLAQNDDEGSGSLDSHLGYALSHDGTYYVRVRDYWDDGGTDYTYTLHLLTDAITPTAEITTPPSDAWIDPTWQVITASVSDGESGVRNVRFYWHDADWENSDWVVLGEDWVPGDGWSYGFDASVITEQVGGAFYIYAFDWAGNYAGAASWNLGIDRTPPSVTPDAYPSYGDAPFRDFRVSWWGFDNLSGIASYDVQYQDGALGAWTDWMMGVTQTYTRFVGIDDHTYYFRARARDHGGNLCAYSTDEVSHTVDICDTTADAYESDDVISSASWITPDGYSQIHNVHVEEDVDWVQFAAQAGVTYTLSTGNTGDHADTVLALYDTDGSTLLAENDDCPGRWPASCLDWQAPSNGTYYVKITHWDPWAYGCTTEYGLSIVSNREPSLDLGDPGTSFRYTDTFGATEQAYIPDTQHLNAPNGMFIDSSDNLYVVEELGARLLGYRLSDGSHLLEIGAAGLHNRGAYTFDHPQDVTVDGSGHIWMVDRHRVAQYDASGGFLQEFPPDDPWNAGDDDTHFDTPGGIAFDSGGRMYVVDSNNHRIQVYTFDVDGTPIYSTTIGVTDEPGGDNAHFDRPAQIVVDSSDRLYVIDANNYRVQRCTYAGGWTCTTVHGTGSAGDGSSELDWAYGLGIDPGTDHVYIADGGNGRVKECYDGMFGWACTTFATGLDWPSDVIVDSAGNVYISDWLGHTILKYDSSGTAQGVFLGTDGVPYLTDGGHFNRPHGVAVDSDGHIFLTEYAGYRLVKLNASGGPEWSVGEGGVYGSDDTHFGGLWDGPAGVAVDGSSNAYVADTDNHRVQKCTSSGSCSTFAGVAGEMGSDDDHLEDPFDVAIDADGTVYVADQDNHRVQKCTSSGVCTTFAGVTDVAGSDNVHFSGPVGVAVDGDGNVYVADAWNRRVQKCAPDGSCTTFAGVTGEWGEDFGHFWDPHDVAVDAQGRVYVADIYHQRVQVFDSEGAYLTTIGDQWGSHTGELRHAAGVAVDGYGNLYVTDELNARVQKFVLGVPDWEQVNINGFGDPANEMINALASFDGQLYAGIYNPDVGAQLWRKEADGAWTAVSTTGFGDPSNVAIDHLVEFDGHLYAGTWNETPGGSDGGQLWRSATGAPGNWQQVVVGGFDGADNSEVFRLTAFGGWLYAATWNSITGGEVWRSGSGGSGTWARVVDGGFGDIDNIAAVSLSAFDGRLYASAYNTDTGAEVWRTSSGDSGAWEQVNADGFGDADNWSVTLEPFDGYLYAGVYNYYGGNPGLELWRCRQCDGADWEQVAVDKGFGDTENRSLHALATFAGDLYGFTDNHVTGMEVWRSADGTIWEQVGPDGLGDSNNYAPYWDNSVAVFDDYIHVGTWNPAHGGEVWRSVLQQVRVGLTASITAGLVPLTVVFTNTSTGDYDTCQWDFGDGETSGDCDNPIHEYASSSSYTVTLTVSGVGGMDTLTRANYITAYEAVDANFTASITAGIAPLTVVFTNTSTGDYDTCQWDFGDGETSDNCNPPIHDYTSGGIYTVSLTVSGLGGANTQTRTGYVAVYDPVDADFSADPTSGPSPLVVSFTNLSTGDYDACTWDFGDGDTSGECDDPSHEYAPEPGTSRFPVDGVYTVTLTVGGLGGTDAVTYTRYITTYEPAQADFSASPVTGTAPLTVTFANHSQGAYATCLWEFGDGTVGGDCLDPTHVYTTGGVYTVALTVDGLGGHDSLTRTRYLTIRESVRADFSAAPTSGPAPLTVAFSNLSTGDYDTCRWDFGDGESSFDCTDPSHTYVPDEGTLKTRARYAYTVTLTIEGAGGRGTETKRAYITAIDPYEVYLPLVVRRWSPVYQQIVSMDSESPFQYGIGQ